MELCHEIKCIIPPLSYSTHKGQSGRIGIVGGCSIYTGAPYFAAISAMKTGCDLAHVFCTKDASPVIKSYSPELIVHPILDHSCFMQKITERLPTLHSLIIGPGLGREQSIFDSIGTLINDVKKRNMPLILDADALYFIKDNPDIISSYKKTILTPNKREFILLYKAALEKDLDAKLNITGEQVKHLANCMGNVTILQKGQVDIISNGIEIVECNEIGSPRRCGGQGDLLSGALATFSHWAYQLHDSKAIQKHSSTILAAAAACLLTRRCNNFAFKKFQRSMTTTDMIQEINVAFSSLFS